MRFGDKVQFGDLEQLKANLNQIVDQLSEASSTINISDGNDYLNFAIKTLISYSAKQVDQLSKNIDAPIDLLAWKARNLFECYLLCKYITIDNSKAKELVKQKAVDELQIYEGLLELHHSGVDPSVKKPIEDRMSHIRSTLKKYKLKESQHWTVGFLATKVNERNDYQAFFKLYSKYVHPSSWLIMGDESEYDTPTFSNVFILKAQNYASCILKLSEKYTS